MTQLHVPSSTMPGKIQPGGQYFEQRKKGQMNQLKNQLNNVINQSDVKKGKQVIKKVIGYMTLGMDASPVFSQMCRASFINDQIMKKMIYFYLTTYAEDNPDLSIMAINTFKKDCKHSSAKIRGLALRNLCSFRSSDYVNSVLPTIRQLLMDFDSYVKKTAIMGVLKVFYHDPSVIISDSSILDSLSTAIKDSDPLVSMNSIMALDQILVSQGGIPLNRKLFFYLLNRLKQYNEWQQSTIIDILYRYDPGNDKQNYQIMTLLWQNLKRSSTALVLGSIRIIVKLAKQKQQLFKNVVDKIKAPLLTLMSTNQNNGCYETTFIVLQHIQYVIQYMNGKSQYQKDFKYFYCKNDQPTYIKSLKVKILGMLANQYNLGDMLNELNDYANQVDIEIARKAVTTLAQIALRLPEVSKPLLINLVSFYKTQHEHLVNSSVICFHKILRKYPKLFSDVKPVLTEYHQIINQTESTKAFIWILGTFADQIDDAPYILEQFVQDQQKYQLLEDQVKQVLLTQIVQTFVKRPPQTFKTLGKIFKLIFHNDKSSVILSDHAAFYYRALKDNPQQVKRGFQAIQLQMTKERQEIIQVNAQEDFNNLGIIYKKKQVKFIKNYEYFISMRNKQLGLIQAPAIEEDDQQANQDIIQQKPEEGLHFNLQNQLENTQLQTNITLTAQQFQETWNSHQAYNQITTNLQNQQYLDEQSVQQLFKMWNLFSMASAQQEEGAILKFYMYAKHIRGGFICIQVQFHKRNKTFTLTTKACQQNLAILANRYIKQFMTMNEFITQ